LDPILLDFVMLNKYENMCVLNSMHSVVVTELDQCVMRVFTVFQ